MDFDEQYKITRDNREVRMKNLKTEDSGRYECQVINGFGHISVEFILQVYGEYQRSGTLLKNGDQPETR